MNFKPHPIGILPYGIWKDRNPNPSPGDTFRRLIELQFAIDRYINAGARVPPVWIRELKEKHQH